MVRNKDLNDTKHSEYYYYDDSHCQQRQFGVSYEADEQDNTQQASELARDIRTHTLTVAYSTREDRKEEDVIVGSSKFQYTVLYSSRIKLFEHRIRFRFTIRNLHSYCTNYYVLEYSSTEYSSS